MTVIAPILPIEIPRHQAWHFEIGFPGLDLTAKEFSFEVRPNPEGNATRVVLTKGAGIAAALSQVGGQNYTTISLDASKMVIEALPLSAPLGSDEECWYGFKVDGIEYLRGPCKIGARANHQ